MTLVYLFLRSCRWKQIKENEADCERRCRGRSRLESGELRSRSGSEREDLQCHTGTRGHRQGHKLILQTSAAGRWRSETVRSDLISLFTNKEHKRSCVWNLAASCGEIAYCTPPFWSTRKFCFFAICLCAFDLFCAYHCWLIFIETPRSCLFTRFLFCRPGTGCLGRGDESAQLSEETSWTSFMTRTRLWTTSVVYMKRRREMPGPPPTSLNIPISFILWRLTTDR